MGSWRLPLLVTWSEVWVTRTTWVASEVRRVLILQPVAWALTPKIWYQKSTDSGAPTGYRELDGVGAETISLQSERIPDSPCLVIWGLTWGLGRWVVRLGHCTQKLLAVVYIFKLLAESIVYQWGVIWQCLVLIPPPTSLCHRASYLRFPHLNRGNFLYEFFELMISREYKQFIPISLPDLSIFHHNVLIWKNFLYLLVLDN